MAKREVEVNAPAEGALMAIKAILEQRGWTIRTFKLEEGIVTARTPASIFSWGEDVTIRAKSGATRTVIGIESLPVAQVFDWGRSESNVKALASEIGALRVTE